MSALPRQQDESEEITERFICFPENFFMRVDIRRLHKRWPQTLQWFMAILVAIKRCEADGRLVVNRVPVTINDIDILHCWDTIDPDWVRACCESGLLAIDPVDDCIVVPHRRRYIKYPSETAAAERARKQRSADAKRLRSDFPESNPEHKKNLPETLHELHESTSHESTSHDITVQESIPPHPPSGGTDGRTDSSSTSSPFSQPIQDPAEVYSQCAQRVSPGRLSAKDFERFEELDKERESGGYAVEDLNDALTHAVEATNWAIRHGPNKVRIPRAYLVEAARQILPYVTDRNIDRRASYRDGFPDPGPLIFRPPERGDP